MWLGKQVRAEPEERIFSFYGCEQNTTSYKLSHELHVNVTRAPCDRFTWHEVGACKTLPHKKHKLVEVSTQATIEKGVTVVQTQRQHQETERAFAAAAGVVVVTAAVVVVVVVLIISREMQIPNGDKKQQREETENFPLFCPTRRHKSPNS
ncbi:hypothetical protein RUM44_010466 [Polyplax serrata]|uniref:Uncharacterized protein n=1 Tax=Polyplax serrata TaxID=468196 RepID=A0ABR1AVL3_POLSC